MHYQNNQQQQQNGQQPQIDLSNTEPILNDEGGPLFLHGFILRSVSKFITGQPQDTIMPIPVFYDPKTMKVLEASVPDVLREDYQDLYKDKDDE